MKRTISAAVECGDGGDIFTGWIYELLASHAAELKVAHR